MKNKSFKYTFYSGLIIILLVSVLITLFSINIYRSISGRYSERKKIETEIVERPLDSEIEIVHDTVFLEKSVTKPVDTPKQKKEVKVVEKPDTSSLSDTIK